MLRRAWWFAAVPAVLMVPLLAWSMGGWAIITVEDLPDHAVAGQPLTLRFTVRQHGVTPLAGLTPRLEARADRSQPKVVATARSPGRPTAGQYVATFTLPAPGEWAVTIHSGFGNSKLTLLPIPVIRPGAVAPATLAVAERGRRTLASVVWTTRSSRWTGHHLRRGLGAWEGGSSRLTSRLSIPCLRPCGCTTRLALRRARRY